jgi:DNA-binding MarR family transcriptional regulator
VVDPEQPTLAETFWSVARRMRHLSQERLAPWDISPSHARVLGVLGRHGTMRLSELSQHLHIAPRSTTEVVDALQERHLVDRLPDPSDRRATLVTLTDQGREVAGSIRQARSDEAEAFFRSLSQTDRAQLARILGKLTG